jgi:hypothetical protein
MSCIYIYYAVLIYCFTHQVKLVFPLLDIAMMQMHWEVVTLVLTEVMIETTAPAPSDDSGDGNDGNQLPPGELTSKKKRGRSSKVDNMLHGLSDALARYLYDVTAGRRAGCKEVVGGRLAETK